MDNKLPIKRLIICSAVAVAAIGLGTYNIIFSYYDSMRDYVFLSLFAAVGMTAIGEIFAALSKFPIISYIISVVICAAALQAITPFNIIFPRADYYYMDEVFEAYNSTIMLCLALYSIAFMVSILFGIFILHRKDVFKSRQDQP